MLLLMRILLGVFLHGCLNGFFGIYDIIETEQGSFIAAQKRNPCYRFSA